MEKQKQFYDILEKYVPVNSVHYCFDLWTKYPFFLKITRERSSKLGDYRFNSKLNTHTITINHSLNQYNFLITYLHEVAHLVAHLKYGKNKKPHGKEWKRCFQEVAAPVLSQLIFPEDVLIPFIKYLKNPSASSCSDKTLYKALRHYDEESDLLMLSELNVGEQFLFRKRIFVKENTRRTKALCKEIISDKKYLIPLLAMVLKIDHSTTSKISYG